MSKPLFHPWTGKDTPLPPKGWGLDAYRGKVSPFVCSACKKQFKLGEQYVYSYTNKITVIVHNTKKCWANRA